MMGFGWNAKGQDTSGVARSEGGDPTERSMFGQLLWKPTPNRRAVERKSPSSARGEGAGA